MQNRICGLALGAALGMVGCDEVETPGEEGGGTTEAADGGGLDDDQGPGMTGQGGEAGESDGGSTGGEIEPGNESTDGGGETGAESTGAGTTGEGTTGEGTTGGEDTGDYESSGGEDTGDYESTGGEESGDYEESGGESGEQNIEISGVVVADVAPDGDGIGTLYVGLTPDVDCFDGDSSFVDIINNADLSEIGNTVPFSISAPGYKLSGGYLLQVFLDDNGDAASQNPGPGDMTMFPTGFEESAGCFDLPDLDGDINGLVVELDYIIP